MTGYCRKRMIPLPHPEEANDWCEEGEHRYYPEIPKYCKGCHFFDEMKEGKDA